MPFYQIPHTSRYIETSNIFVANFNVPLLGGYDFKIPANTGVKILDLITNTVYLIERVSIGGNISEENYLDAISVIPKINLRKKISNEIVYKFPFPVSNYYDDKSITAWVISEKSGDELIADFTGQLNQTAALVGKSVIDINVSYSIYAIESTEFYRKFRDVLSGQVGAQVTGAIR